MAAKTLFKDAIEKDVPTTPAGGGCTYVDGDSVGFPLVIGEDCGGAPSALLDWLGK